MNANSNNNTETIIDNNFAIKQFDDNVSQKVKENLHMLEKCFVAHQYLCSQDVESDDDDDEKLVLYFTYKPKGVSINHYMTCTNKAKYEKITGKYFVDDGFIIDDIKIYYSNDHYQEVDLEQLDTFKAIKNRWYENE